MKALRQILNKIAESISWVVLGIMVVLVTWQVVSRYFFHSPVPWTETMTRYLFVWLVLINGAYIFGRREHMNISYVRGKMSPGGQRILCVITEAVSCLFAVVVLVGGGLLAVNVGLPQKDAALEISMGIVYAALPISGVLTAFYTVCNIHDILTGRLDVVETLAKKE